MADQIKRENVGEVSSPATEKTTAPRKEPAFVDTQSKTEPAKDTAADNTPVEGSPERKLPVFKDEVENENSENAEATDSKKVSLGQKKERKLPVFADEVNPFEDDDEDEDDDSDSDIAYAPASFIAPVTVDVSDLQGAETQAPAAPVDNQVDEISLTGEAMPSVVSLGGEQYPDPVVPESAAGENVYSGLYGPVTVKKTKSNDPGRAEASVLLADNKADKLARKNRKVAAAVLPAETGAQDDVAPVAAPIVAPVVAPVVAPAVAAIDISEPVYADAQPTESELYTGDPGRIEAAALLADDKAERARLKELKQAKRASKANASAVVVETEEDAYDEAYDNEPTEDAAPLTVAVVPTRKTASADKYDKKSSKAERREDLKSAYAEAQESKKQRAPEQEPMHDYSDFDAYEDHADDRASAPAVVSTDAYDRSKQKDADSGKSRADKKEEKEALLAVAVAEKQREKADRAAAKADAAAAKARRAEEKAEREATAEAAREAEIAEIEAKKAARNAAISERVAEEAEAKAAEKEAKAAAKEAKAALKEEQKAAHKEEKVTEASKKDNKDISKAEKKYSDEAASEEYDGYENVRDYEETATLIAVDGDIDAEQPKKVRKEFSTDAYDDYMYDKDKNRKPKKEKEPKLSNREGRKIAKERAEYIAEADREVEDNYARGLELESGDIADSDTPIAGAVVQTATVIAVASVVKAKKAKKAAKQPETAETVYSDYTESFDQAMYDAEGRAIAAADAQARADAAAAKAERKSEKADRLEANRTGRYETANEKWDAASSEKEELLAYAKADAQEQKARKADEKAERKAEKLAAKSYVAPMPVFADHEGNFDEDMYNAEQKAIADAKAQVKADAAAAKAERKSEKADRLEAKRTDKYETANEKHELKYESKEELLAHGKADIKEIKERKADEKAERKAEKLAAKSYVAPMPVFADHEGNFDEDMYNAEQKAIADAKAQVKADAAAAKAERKSEKADRLEAKRTDKYETANEKHELKYESKEELLAHGKADIKEIKERKADEKAERKAEKLAAKSYVAPMPIYVDHTENFDQAMYDAEQKAIADAKAQVKADAAAAKAEKKADKADRLEAKRVDAYEKSKGDFALDVEKEKELFAHGYADLDEQKARKAAEKAERKAEKLAAKSYVAPMPIYVDHTESFDQAAYDAEKQAIEDAKAQAKAEARAAKLEKRAASEAKEEARVADSYDKATGEQIAKMEKKAEMLSNNEQSVAENKARRADEKAERKAEKLAAKSVLPPVVLHSDFTESFDQVAYDAEKQAIEDAKVQAKAEARAAKLEKRAASEAKAEARVADSYDKAAGEQIAKMEKKAEMLSNNEQSVAENKARKAAEKAERKAEKLAAKSVLPPVVLHSDFTESFDQAAYDAEKQAIEDAKAQAKAEARAAKLEKRAASEAKEEARVADSYDKATGEQIVKMERKAEYASFLDQADADKKQVKAQEKAKAEQLRAKAKNTPDPDKDYNDPEFISDEFDMQEHYENSSAKLKDATEKNTNKLYGREEIKIAARNSKDSKAVDMLESKFGNSEMLDYAKGYDKDIKRNRKQLERAEKYGKFMLEYGSTYDPEWDGEFNNYGLPAADPFTDGVKLSSSRRRTPKREKLSHFDAEKLSSLARMQCETDNNMIVARLESQHRDLELEVAKAEQDFSGEFRNNKEKRLARENRKKLKNFKTKIGLAQKYEKLDNERYYSVVSTNFERVQLPERADRDDLIAMREELMRLLDIRDEINAQLIQLYTGDEKGNGVNHLKRRNKVVLKARKRAHARYRKYANALHKYRVTRNEKMRIFDRMDEIVELKGELARIKYILRKEKPIARARREYVREKGNAKSNIRYARRYVDRFTKKAIRRAKRRQRRNRAMILSLTALALIAVLGVTVYLIGPQLLGALKTVVPADYHKYIDNILSNWPF